MYNHINLQRFQHSVIYSSHPIFYFYDVIFPIKSIMIAITEELVTI